MSETTMSDYIKGFNAGVDCVLTEIKRLEKIGPVSFDQLLKHLDLNSTRKRLKRPIKGLHEAVFDQERTGYASRNT